MKISKAQYDDFFKDVQTRKVAIPSTGELCELPLLGVKGTQMVSFHSATRSKVVELLPTPALVPADLGSDKTIIGVIAIEYHKRNIQNYSEVVIVIPVRIGAGAAAPTIQDLLADDMGGSTLLVRHIAVTTRSAEIVGNELLGYAKFIGDIRFVDMPDERICVFSEGGQEILRYSVGVSEEYGEYERNTLSVCTYKNDQVYKLTYSSQTRFANAPDRSTLILGDHPLAEILKTLDISPKPLMAKYSPHFQLISDDRNLEVFKP